MTVTRTMPDLRPALVRSSRSHVQLYAVDDVSRSHPRHHHPGFELGLFDAVEHSVIVRGTSHATSRQTLVVLAPGEVHATRSRSRVPMRARLMVLEPELVARRLDANVATVTPRVHQAVLEDPELAARFVDVHAALGRDGGTSLEGEEAELALLIDLAVRHRVLGLEGLPRAGAEPRAIRRAQAYLDAIDDRAVSLDELSGAVGLTRYHLVRVFSRTVGVSPHLYHLRARLRRAQALLDSGRAVAQVAVDTGFHDQSHLHRHFRRWIGLTPTQYAQRRRA